jgi:pyocin large subunit-like protein
MRDRPVGGDLLEFTRADGVITRYDRDSGAFLAFDADGTIRTYFKPNAGERYFLRQRDRG